MKIFIIENPETGETRRYEGTASFTAPWRIKEVINKPTQAHLRIAMWAEKKGLPVADFLNAARWLLQKDCPFCQLGTQVLKAIDELGDERAEELLTRILAAKERNDHAALEEIKKSL